MVRRSEHTKQELIDMTTANGRKIVKKEGLENLSTRKVSDSIGYAVGTIYNIYNDRDDLVIHINLKTLNSLHTALKKVVKANKIFNELKKRPSLFKRIAKKSSIDKHTASNGGLIDFVNENNLSKEIVYNFNKISNNKISRPFMINGNWAIIKKIAKRKAKIPSFQEIKDVIRESLYIEQVKAHNDDIIKNAKITILLN